MTRRIESRSVGKDTTLSLIIFNGRLNEVSFTAEFVQDVSMSWMTSQKNGLSSDEWRKEYSKGVVTEHTSYAIPRLRMLEVKGWASYTTSDIAADLPKIGVSSVEELWNLVLSMT